MMIRSLLVAIIGVACFVSVSGQRGNSDCQVFYKQSLFAIVNQPAGMGVILDYSSRLIVVLDEKQSSIIVVHISEHVRYYLSNQGDTLKKIWCDFEDFFEKLLSLQSFLQTGQEKGQKSQLGTLKQPVRGVLEDVFASLKGTSPMPVELSLLTRLIEQLRGYLSLLYTGSGSFRIAIGVDRFAEENLVVAELLSYSEGKLNTSNVHLEAARIFRAQSGAEVLLEVLSEVGEHSNLIELLGRLFASPQNVLNLLINATSGSQNGLDGRITILINYVEVSFGESSIARLITSILNCNPRTRRSLNGLVNQALREVQKQNGLFHNADGFSLYVSILKGIISNSYTSDNLSLSDIINRLPTKSRSSNNPLFTIMKLLCSFYPNSTVPHFFGSIIEQFHLSVDATPENSHSEVFFKPSLVAIINNSAKMALMIDYSSRLIVVLNGKQSTIIVVHISEHVRYYLSNQADTLNNIWFYFEDFFEELPSLKRFLETGQKEGVKSNLSTLEEPVRGDLIEVFNSLGGSLPMPEELSRLTKLIEALGGSLTAVFKESGSFRIESGVDAFTKVNLGVAALLRGTDE